MNNTFVFPIVRQDFIIPALDSLDGGHTVIVIDQTRGDDRKFDRRLRARSTLVVKANANYGFAQASNLGCDLARTKWVTVCNDDVIFFWDGWWEGIMQTFDRFPTALGVTPMTPKEPGWGYGELDYRVHATLEECLAAPCAVAKKLTEKWNGAVIDGFPAWCVTFRRKKWTKLGMFDERFFPGGGDDYDACARAYQEGYRMLSTSSSWVWHHWGQSKDEPDGLSQACPPAREGWNKLSTKGFGKEGLWHRDCDVWGKNCKRTDKKVWRASL